MTKPIPLAGLVARLAAEHECSRTQAKHMLGSVQPVIRQFVTEGKAVRLPELAIFSAVDVPEWQVHNPSTGEIQIAPATRQVRVAAAGPFKAAVKAGVSG